ncbi:MAG: hypothetical protein JXA37_03730 [Chloroflexia bacterium]|nr:hypothetical protein [Chloroflexia bacterium]
MDPPARDGARLALSLEALELHLYLLQQVDPEAGRRCLRAMEEILERMEARVAT